MQHRPIPVGKDTKTQTAWMRVLLLSHLIIFAVCLRSQTAVLRASCGGVCTEPCVGGFGHRSGRRVKAAATQTPNGRRPTVNMRVDRQVSPVVSTDVVFPSRSTDSSSRPKRVAPMRITRANPVWRFPTRFGLGRVRSRKGFFRLTEAEIDAHLTATWQQSKPSLKGERLEVNGKAARSPSRRFQR